MFATMEKVGDKRVITIPEEFFNDRANGEIGLSFRDDGTVIVSGKDKALKPGDDGYIEYWNYEKGRVKTFEERLVDFYGEDYKNNPAYIEIKNTSPEFIDWGPPAGKEIW